MFILAESIDTDTMSAKSKKEPFKKSLPGESVSSRRRPSHDAGTVNADPGRVNYMPICLSCGQKKEDYDCAGIASIPASGIYTHKGFICDECIEQHFILGNDLLNAVLKYQNLTKTFNDEFYFLAKYFVPEIFRSHRRTIPKELRSKILKRYGYKCVNCGTNDNLTIDHIKPYIKGGPTKDNNLQVLCKSCNSKKGAKQ